MTKMTKKYTTKLDIQRHWQAARFWRRMIELATTVESMEFAHRRSERECWEAINKTRELKYNEN